MVLEIFKIVFGIFYLLKYAKFNTFFSSQLINLSFEELYTFSIIFHG